MERSRLFGTAKETVLLLLERYDSIVSTKVILEESAREVAASSVPAIYRALTILESHGLVFEGDPLDQRRVIKLFERKAVSTGDGERRLLHYGLTNAGRMLATILKLRRRPEPVTQADLVRLAHQFYAHVAGAEPTNAEANAQPE